MNNPLLSTHGLTKRFGGVDAVRSVDFAVTDGELRCLIGPNGAGKSTFFKMLTAQLRPTSGSILFRGVEIAHLLSYQIARLGIGIKTQVPSVFERHSVYDNLWLAASRKHRGRAVNVAVDGILERLALGDLSSNFVAQLAHGQRQRVELGIALATDPALLLLDEPVAGLSPDETVQTAELIREINRSHSLIVVEHDMHFVRMIASRVTVFDRGGILVEGNFDEILQDPDVRRIYLGKRIAA